MAVMIPPIGLLAALKYYFSGNVKLEIAVFMSIGFFLWGYLGAVFAQHIPGHVLRKVFGILFMFVSLKLFFGK